MIYLKQVAKRVPYQTFSFDFLSKLKGKGPTLNLLTLWFTLCFTEIATNGFNTSQNTSKLYIFHKIIPWLKKTTFLLLKAVFIKKIPTNDTKHSFWHDTHITSILDSNGKAWSYDLYFNQMRSYVALFLIGVTKKITQNLYYLFVFFSPV